jgi:hypothetical protein
MALGTRPSIGDDGTGRRWSGGNSDASLAVADASAVPTVFWNDDERRMKQELCGVGQGRGVHGTVISMHH